MFTHAITEELEKHRIVDVHVNTDSPLNVICVRLEGQGDAWFRYTTTSVHRVDKLLRGGIVTRLRGVRVADAMRAVACIESLADAEDEYRLCRERVDATRKTSRADRKWLQLTEREVTLARERCEMSSTRLVVLRGIPGAGKSTFVRKHLSADALIASADDGMVEGEGEDAKYVFSPKKLPEAHGACLRKVINALRGHAFPNIVVDNTSTSIAEVAPYVAVGQAYGAEVIVITLRIDPAIAGPRNTHGVPQAGVDRMAKALDEGSAAMPPWWCHEVWHWNPEASMYVLG
jgi:predicted kinase